MLTVGAGAAWAQPTVIHFAGFAMAGDAAAAGHDYYYTSKLFDVPNGISKLDFNRALIGRLDSQSLDAVTVSAGLGDYKKGDALVLAFVLTWENVSVERITNFTKLAINLQGEALLVDFRTKQILASYPFGTEYIDALRGDPDEGRILDNLRRMYDPQNGAFVQAFLESMHRVAPKSSFGARIQIGKIDVSSNAAAELARYQVEPALAERLLGGAFEQYLSRNGNIPVLPHANSGVLGGVMAARFINGDAFDFTIPSADYSVALTLTNVRKVLLSQNAANEGYAYAAYLDVAVVQPLSGKNALDSSFKYPVVKIIASGGVPDDASAFQEALLSISDQITKQFAAPEKSWLRKWQVKGDADLFLQMPKLLARCR